MHTNNSKNINNNLTSLKEKSLNIGGILDSKLFSNKNHDIIYNDHFLKNKSVLNSSENKMIEYLKKKYDFSSLPKNLTISTMTLTCRFDSLVNIQNIGRYLNLEFGSIIYIKFNVDNVRSLINFKTAKNKIKKKKINFFNQATLIVDLKNQKRINVKIFKNGSIQVTGCRNITHFIDTIQIICSLLNKKKSIYHKKEKRIYDIIFSDKPENFVIHKMLSFQIRMINSNFNIGFKINREKLYSILFAMNIPCTFEPCIHACVNIKFLFKNTDIISIFVFESGSIIITGAKNIQHILYAYIFINEQLYSNFKHISKIEIDDFLRKPNIQKLINDHTNVKLL